MNITDAGTTLVISEATPEEKKRILAATKQPTEHRPETMSRKEAAAVFGVHPGSLKRWEKSGKLRPIRITARTVRYDAAEVRAIVAGGER
ncbi:MerR family transcriptional regulator [Pontiella sulfatireligans]|uniref:HTH merR-type domain-containing protein n=1 Tax=Pontiella sulfatireligans TaxID=2750658 RepID=A0A6C2UP80_9BACT|nr:MerR family transcriptional regulator [Pontiella sulfatireligans]VGO21124.1 hypothetical protein SCARR_03194 [Pontiella sulfatireligans]